MRHFFWQTMLYEIVSDGKWRDSRIVDLKSITFCGRRLTRRRISDIQRTVVLFLSLSRDELASAICSHLGWRTPKGGESPGSCLWMLHVYVIRGLHTVFGIKRKAGADIDHFIHSDQRSRGCGDGDRPRKGTFVPCGAHCLRLVKYLVGKTVFILGTPCWIRRNTPSRNGRSGIAQRKMGRGRMVQGVQTTDGGGRLPWTKRAGSETGTLCRLLPDRHDPAVLRSRGPSMERKPARPWQAAQADPFQARTGDGGGRHRETVAEAGIRATGNGHPSGSRHHPMPKRLRPGRSFERRSRKPVKKWQRGRRLQAKTAD